ncbi:hypothetical protein Tco_0585537 [Tanacetum coccineum]
MVSKIRDISKYCEIHQDYSHDTNACRELKSHIEKTIKSGKLAYLIKGIRKGKAEQTDTQLEEWIAPTVKAKPATEGKEEPILVIGMVNNPLKRNEPPIIISIEEIIFPPIRNRAPSLGKEIREKMRDVYTTLSGFSGKQVNPLGEISLLIIVGEAPHHKNERITFLIVRFDSPNNMLIGRTATAGLGMIPSMMHSAVLYQSEARPMVIMSEYQDYSNMTGIPRTPKIRGTKFATEQKLNEDKKITPVQQKKMRMASEWAATTSKEVEELRKA